MFEDLEQRMERLRLELARRQVAVVSSLTDKLIAAWGLKSARVQPPQHDQRQRQLAAFESGFGAVLETLVTCSTCLVRFAELQEKLVRDLTKANWGEAEETSRQNVLAAATLRDIVHESAPIGQAVPWDDVLSRLKADYPRRPKHRSDTASEATLCHTASPGSVLYFKHRGNIDKDPLSHFTLHLMFEAGVGDAGAAAIKSPVIYRAVPIDFHALRMCEGERVRGQLWPTGRDGTEIRFFGNRFDSLAMSSMAERGWPHPEIVFSVEVMTRLL
ncbi:MAG: hypothetical protein ABL907_05065 [Hyphomicrobium sp.]